MKKAGKIFSWVITIFMLLAAFVYFPSIASVFMLLFAVLALPVRSIQDFWTGKHVTGVFRTVILVVLFLASMYLAPIDRVKQSDGSNRQTPAADSGTADQEPELEPAELLPVTLDVAIKGEAGRPSFIINTNLPDETVLMLTVTGEGGERFQGKVTVENGGAESEVFGSESKPVPDKFSLGVSMSLPSLQSDAVRAVIGDKGEFISGPYVKESEIDEENVISADFDYDFSVSDSTSTKNTVVETPPPPAAPEVPAQEHLVSDSSANEATSTTQVPTGGGNGNNFNTYDNPSQQNTDAEYVLNTSTMKFHYPSCSSVPTIASDNYAASNESRDSLIAMGYDPCGKCNP